MSTVEPIDSGLCLRVLEGSHHDPVHSLTRPVISIGRATPENPYSDSYLTFPEPTLSRLHAVLTWEAGAKSYLAHHRSQTNPTLLNGRPLKKSQLLKPGDTLALGRLVVVLDRAETGQSSTVALAPQAAALTLNVRGGEPSRAYAVPVDKPGIRLAFTDTRGTAAVSAGEDDVVPIQAAARNTLSFELDAEAQRGTVETEKDEPEVRRRTEIAGGTLYVPVRVNAPLPFTRKDVLLHQDYEIWLAASEAQAPGDGTLDGNTIDSPPSQSLPEGGRLQFLNGAWKGATVIIPAESSRVLELGPRSRSFHHDPPLTNAPVCRLTVQNQRAQIRVVRMSDDQFVDVDGELLFTGESLPLNSGSKILLGEHELRWCVPRLHDRYTRFQVVAPDGAHSIEKSQVRLGTAAHCEVRFQLPALAPVVGLLRFEGETFIYEHLNIAYPVKVDGVETSAGLEAPVGAGSKLELAPGVLISVEEIGG